MVFVVRLSRDGPMSISRLTAGTTVTRQAVTKHLHVLRAVGLAKARQVGRETVWTLEPRRLREAREHLAAISSQWDAAIERLRALVEDDD